MVGTEATDDIVRRMVSFRVRSRAARRIYEDTGEMLKRLYNGSSGVADVVLELEEMAPYEAMLTCMLLADSLEALNERELTLDLLEWLHDLHFEPEEGVE
jgi:hypothetical protein